MLVYKQMLQSCLIYNCYEIDWDPSVLSLIVNMHSEAGKAFLCDWQTPVICDSWYKWHQVAP